MIARTQALTAIPGVLIPTEATPILRTGITMFNDFHRSGSKTGDLVAVQRLGGLGGRLLALDLLNVSAIRNGRDQAGTPNNAPTPAVTTIAKAPQTVTRVAAIIAEAPPTCAAKEPKRARKRSELPETAHISAEVGTSRTIKRGRAAPTENVTADAKAA